jgi:hypothetical protein
MILKAAGFRRFGVENVQQVFLGESVRRAELLGDVVGK